MNLLNDNAHRPWPLPSKPWIMKQAWRDCLFMHWPVPANQLRSLVPLPLQIDTFQGTAWLGMIVTVTDGVYLRGLPFLSLARKFPQINVRTYVQYDGKPGVYFFSLDTNHGLTCAFAKRWFHLPYYSAQLSFHHEAQTFNYNCIRKSLSTNGMPITCQGHYKPYPEVTYSDEDTLDAWLTERYCLFSSDNGANIDCVDIHHRRWPLQRVKAQLVRNTLFAPLSLDLVEANPLAHYSKGVDVLLWNIRRVHR